MANMYPAAEINLIIVDRPDNFNTEEKRNFKPELFFRSHKYVQDEEELKKYLESLAPLEYILVFVHADRKTTDFHIPLANMLVNIRKVVGKTIKLRLLTSDRKELVTEKFQEYDVDRYHDILRNAENNDYMPDRKSVV